MPRKGRARRFREARELKQGYDDGLFKEDERTSLADIEVEDGEAGDDVDDEEFDDDEESSDSYDWDPDRERA